MNIRNLLIGVTFFLAIIGIFMLLRKPASESSTNSATTLGETGTEKVTMLINGQPMESYPQIVTTQTLQGSRSLSSADLNEISHFETQGNNTIIVFNDGSRTTVSETDVGRLQSQVRQRLEYSRGQ
ncbi:MAG: hypothetical protein ACRCYY_05460 [Trueperaceae bacterium]